MAHFAYALVAAEKKRVLSERRSTLIARKAFLKHAREVDAKSALARARWARAINAVMEANAARRQANADAKSAQECMESFRKQVGQFALALFKVLILLALAYFLVCGRKQEVREVTNSTAENRVPTLMESDVEFVHTQEMSTSTPAIGYTEKKASTAVERVKTTNTQQIAKKSVKKTSSASTQIAKLAVNQEGGWGFIAILILATMMI